MAQYLDLPRMLFSDLVRCCAEQTALFFHQHDSDPRFCFELFRRAFVEGDGLAWEAIYQQYCSLVAGWVNNHPEILRCGGEVQDYVNRAFERMWAAVSPSKFERFRDLNALLAYLKMCAHSAVLEDVRRAGSLTHMVALEELPQDLGSNQHEQADMPFERAAYLEELKERLWSAVNAKLQSDKERIVVHCLFELDLKPRMIYDRHLGTFRDVREIYLIRQIVLERLRRDPDLRALTRDDA